MASFHQIETRDLATTHSTRSGVRRLFVALAVALVVWTTPYWMPGLERYRPWTPEAGLPFARLFGRDHTGPVVAEAAGGVSSRTAITASEREMLRFASKRLPAPAPVAAPAPAPTPTPWIEQSPGVAPDRPAKQVERLVAKATPSQPVAAPRPADVERRTATDPPASKTATVKVPIEDPNGALIPFFKALARTAAREPGALTRISQWGDSATAADKITAITRLLLQKRFGDGGPGFMLAVPGTRWYRVAGVGYAHNGWTKLRITHGVARDGRYGIGGIRAVGKAGAYTTYRTYRSRKIGGRISRIAIYYRKGPYQGQLAVSVDGGRERRLSAKASRWQDAVETIQVKDRHHQVLLRVRRGPVSTYGVALERDGPGVVLDNLGMVGYASKRLLNIDPEHFKAQLAFRKPDLMALMWGGNYLSFPSWRPKVYAKELAKVLRRFRSARPQASCLVLSPLDHGEKHRGRVRTIPKLLSMVAVQREVALANGCAFYNFFEAMGGEGVMARWITTRPKLALHDMAHVTRHGARILGSLYYKALMASFAEYMSKRR